MNYANNCRCCLANNCIKDLSNSYIFEGHLENYGVLLTKTFKFTLDSSAKFICEVCIIKLRDAAAFREQILDAEKTLNEQRKQLTDGEEVFPIKFEIKDERSDVPKEEQSYVDDSNSSPASPGVSNNEECPDNDKVKTEGNKAKIKCKNDSEKKRSVKEAKGPTDNTLKLISNSNLCLFRPHKGNTEFACFVCKQTSTLITDIRAHSETHTPNEFLTKIKPLRGMSYRLADISNLKCLCRQPCDDLDALTSHLTANHDVSFQNGGHLLIPFRLQNGLQCVLCGESFNTFYRLSNHMNSHATSNICESCGTAYYNRSDLRLHVRTRHRACKCSKCPMTLPTSSSLAQHYIKVHNRATTRTYHCDKCNFTFNYRYKLTDHMVSCHDFPQAATSECHLCGKNLKNVHSLKAHIRRFHLKERKFQCTLCELRFFTKTDKIRHEKTHQDKSLFSCSLCETKFKSKDSQRRHLKRQHAVTK